MKWCQFADVPDFNPRFDEMLIKLYNQHPKYAFFIGFDYCAKWNEIVDLLSKICIDIEHAFFAIRVNGDSVMARGDLFSGMINRRLPLSKEAVIQVKEQSSDYYTFLNEKANRVILPDDENIHYYLETDDFLALHINTTIKNKDGACFVDAEHVNALLRNCGTNKRSKVTVAFGCDDPDSFVDKEMFAVICSMYQTKLYMYTGDSEFAVDKVLSRETLWKVGNQQGATSFYFYCFDTDNEYCFVKKYVRQRDLSWRIDEDFGTPGHRTRCIHHHGKRYLFENEALSDSLHSIAFKELSSGLSQFLAKRELYQEWIINTFEYSGEFDYVVEHFIYEIIEENHCNWVFARFDQCKQPEEYSSLQGNKNILLTCRIECLDNCRQWLDKVISQSITKSANRKYRIIVIRNDCTENVIDSRKAIFNYPQDICDELNLSETRLIKGDLGRNIDNSALSRRVEEKNNIGYLKGRIFTQYALSVIIQMWYQRTSSTKDKNMPIIDNFENFLHDALSIPQKEMASDNNKYSGTEEVSREENNIERSETSTIEEKENSHD